MSAANLVRQEDALALTPTQHAEHGATSGPTRAFRVKGFVKYFNSYLASIFVAAIPAPLSQWKLMPIMDDHRGLLSIVTPVFCFLTWAYLFFIRDALAGPMFPLHARRGRLLQALRASPGQMYVWGAFWRRLWGLVPLACICGSFYFASIYYGYYVLITDYLAHKAPDERTDIKVTGDTYKLPLFYILSFVLAEAAFVWMALKEYLQDVLGLTDKELIQDTTPEQGTALGTDVSAPERAP